METHKITPLPFFLLALAIIPLSVSAQDSPDDIVAAHNAVRQDVGVGPISWDDAVASYAQQYASQRAGDCQLIHSGGPYGENIAWGSGDLLVVDAVTIWPGERVDFIAESNTCTAPEGSSCGHYTQMVWRASVRLGCAKVTCASGGTFITCNYDPPGNIVGQRPY